MWSMTLCMRIPIFSPTTEWEIWSALVTSHVSPICKEIYCVMPFYSFYFIPFIFMPFISKIKTWSRILQTRCSTYLQSASLHHDLLSIWLNSCQGIEPSLENHGWFLGVHLYFIKLRSAPFHIHCKKRQITRTSAPHWEGNFCPVWQSICGIR